VEVYVACARGVIDGVRRLLLHNPIGTNAAYATFYLVRKDLAAAGAAQIARSTNYNLADVQRAAWLKHGDAAGLERFKERSKRERERLAKEARRAEVLAAFAERERTLRYVRYGVWQQDPVAVAESAARLARRLEVEALARAAGVPARFLEHEARHSRVAGVAVFIHGSAADPPFDVPPSAAAVAARVERCHRLAADVRLALAPQSLFAGGNFYGRRWENPAFRGHVATGAPALGAVIDAFLRVKRRAQLAERCAALGIACTEAMPRAAGEVPHLEVRGRTPSVRRLPRRRRRRRRGCRRGDRRAEAGVERRDAPHDTTHFGAARFDAALMRAVCEI
jgi:hypothetical protein